MKKHRNANPPLTDIMIPNFDTISSAVHPKWSWQIGVPTLKIYYLEIKLVINPGQKIFAYRYCFYLRCKLTFPLRQSSRSTWKT